MQFTENLPQNTNRRLSKLKILVLALSAIIVISFIAANYKNFLFSEEASLEAQSASLQKIKTLFLRGETDQMLMESQKFIEEYPNSNLTPIALFFTGRSYQKIDRPQEALAAFLKIIDEYPDYDNVPLANKNFDIPLVIYELGVTYLDLGDEKKADEYFNIILGEYPDTGAWHLVQSEYYKIEPLYEAGKYQEAIDKSYQVLEKNPGDEFVGGILYTIGRGYYDLGDHNNALTIFQKIIDEYPDDSYAPRAVYKMGWIYYKLGEYERVEEYANKLLKEYPDVPRMMADNAQKFLEDKK